MSNFQDDGGRVVYTYKVLVGDAVVDSGDDGLTIVRDGKIVFDGIVRTEPEWATAVVEGYYGAYNAGNLDLATQYLADDVNFVNPTGTYVGKAKARENLEAIKKDGLTFELSNFKDVNGRVTYSYKVVIGGEAVETGDGGLTIVKNGLIVFDGTVETEPQLPQSGMDPTTHMLLWAATLGGILLVGGAILMFRKRKSA